MALSKWDFDLIHSHVGFAVRHLVISKVRGQFAKWGGTIELDPADPTTAKVDVQIDAASIDTREPQRDGHLRSADFFDVEKYPQITFKGTRIEKTGADKLHVSGDLTIHGVTNPVVLDAEFNGPTKDMRGSTRIGVVATTKISRKEFGLTWNAVLEAGGVAVSDSVEITIEFEATQA